MTRLTNTRFADLTGCDFTSASKIRHGQRQPSLSLFARIVDAFHLDANDALDAYKKGREAFTRYLNEMVFEAAEALDEPADTPAEPRKPDSASDAA